MEANILQLFHHIHHECDVHAVHHCGGAHVAIDPQLDYTIRHCPCGKHVIDRPRAVGHATGAQLENVTIPIVFLERCPVEDGWHVESGKME
ncbi:MAG: hypothetical protein ABIG71_03375 [Candidatus Uhrbacteria bacterium]